MGAGEVCNAECRHDPSLDLFPVGVWAQYQLETPHEGAHPNDIEVGGRRAKIPNQALDKPRAIASLEGDFLIVNDDGVHTHGLPFELSERQLGRAMSADDGALDGTGQTGLDPITGQIEPSDHRLGARPRWLAG